MIEKDLILMGCLGFSVVINIVLLIIGLRRSRKILDGIAAFKKRKRYLDRLTKVIETRPLGG